MPDKKDDSSSAWFAVIGRSLAFLCLTQADLRDKDLATQGRFLETLGMTRKESAALLGTSYASLTEMLSRTSKRKGEARGSKKKR